MLTVKYGFTVSYNMAKERIIAFKVDDFTASRLDELSNKSEFIREAVQDKLDRDALRKVIDGVESVD